MSVRTKAERGQPCPRVGRDRKVLPVHPERTRAHGCPRFGQAGDVSPSEAGAFDEDVSDPAKPAPFIPSIAIGMTREQMLDENLQISTRANHDVGVRSKPEELLDQKWNSLSIWRLGLSVARVSLQR